MADNRIINDPDEAERLVREIMAEADDWIQFNKEGSINAPLVVLNSFKKISQLCEIILNI